MFLWVGALKGQKDRLYAELAIYKFRSYWSLPLPAQGSRSGAYDHRMTSPKKFAGHGPHFVPKCCKLSAAMVDIARRNAHITRSGTGEGPGIGRQ